MWLEDEKVDVLWVYDDVTAVADAVEDNAGFCVTDRDNEPANKLGCTDDVYKCELVVTWPSGLTRTDLVEVQATSQTDGNESQFPGEHDNVTDATFELWELDKQLEDNEHLGRELEQFTVHDGWTGNNKFRGM